MKLALKSACKACLSYYNARLMNNGSTTISCVSSQATLSLSLILRLLAL